MVLGTVEYVWLDPIGHFGREFCSNSSLFMLCKLNKDVLVFYLLSSAPTLLTWWRARGGRQSGLVLCVLVGIGANAVATGALSGPHDRYQARIAWLLPLVALLAATGRQDRPGPGCGLATRPHRDQGAPA